jgi:hypothetical protein
MATQTRTNGALVGASTIKGLETYLGKVQNVNTSNEPEVREIPHELNRLAVRLEDMECRWRWVCERLNPALTSDIPAVSTDDGDTREACHTELAATIQHANRRIESLVEGMDNVLNRLQL